MCVMEHQDAEVSDVIMVLKPECAEKLDDTAAALRKMGMEIEKTDGDNGVIEGTIGADKLDEIRKWPCVEYVRVDFTYVASYPADVPPNQAPAPGATEESED